MIKTLAKYIGEFKIPSILTPICMIVEVIDVVIDHNSFKAIKEKNGIVNKVDMNMMNDSLKQFEESAREKAMEKKILEKADEYARKMIESFVNSVVDVNEYQIVYVEKQ